MINIDFFCCNSGEVVFYLPIYKYLESAKMVVPNSRYDRKRTEKFLDKLGIPHQKKPSKNVDIVITTQPKKEPWTYQYWKDVPKIRIMYSLCEKNKMHQREFCEKFNLILSPGQFSHDIISQFTNSVIVGYPKYDNYFNGLLKKENILNELKLNLDNNKKTILYVPTSNQERRSSIPIFCDAIKRLANEFNIIFKPHVYTEFNEDFLAKMFKKTSVITLNALAPLDKLLTISDLVISDAQSGVPWECIIVNKPVIVCTRKSDISPEVLELEICNGNIVPTIENPDLLRKVIANILTHSKHWEKKRLTWAEKICSYRDGTAGKHATEAILKFAETNSKLPQVEKISLETKNVREHYNNLWARKHTESEEEGGEEFETRMKRKKYILLKKKLNQFLSTCTDKHPKILDLGCGPGYMARFIELKSPNIIGYLGLDISNVAIKFAHDLCKDSNFFNFQAFNLNDLGQLQNLLNEYKIVLGIDILEHLSENLAHNILHMIAQQSNYILINAPTEDSALLKIKEHIWGISIKELNCIFNSETWKITKSKVVKWNQSGDEMLFIAERKSKT